MKVSRALSFYKTQVALAEALSISQPAVSNWVKRGAIPNLQQLRLQALTDGKLRADRSITR